MILRKELYSIFITWVLGTCLTGVAHARLDDTQLRQELTFAYRPIKPLTLTGDFRLDLKDNISTFRRNNFELGVEYEALKWLKVFTSYRFITSYEKDKHRFALGFSAKEKTTNKKFSFQFRTKLEYESDYLDRDYLKKEAPDWVLRLRGKFQYEPIKKISLYTFSESFAQNFSSQYRFYKMRYGIGISYEPKKRHTLSLEYYYQHEFYPKKPEQIQVIGVGYEYELYKKKKNSKESKPAETL